MSKPGPQDMRGRPDVTAVGPKPEVTRWALSPDRVIEVSNATTAPSFAYNVVRMKPKMVYTDGFRQDASTVDTSSFTGESVKFFAVAHFD
jgi:hypothetical protein